MSGRKANEQVVQRHVAAEMRHDMEETLATLHPDCVFEDGAVGLHLRGRQGARRHYALWWNAFGARLDLGALHWVRDDLAIGESAFVGRHVGDFLGLRPTGRVIRLPFLVKVSFRDGLLSGEHFYYDLNGLLAQLGAPAFPIPQER